MQRRSFLKLVALGGVLPAMPITSIASVIRPQTSATDDYLHKMRHPNNAYAGDVTSSDDEQRLVRQLALRLGNVKQLVGHGNFSVLGFDDMLRYASNYSQIGTFEKEETDFLEKLFYEDAMHYGFYGEKPLTRMTATIDQRSIEKVPHTGQYLFKGEPLALYKKIRSDIGDTITLTSGVRSVVKQMHLFLRKATKYECNLSLASRSLAPPGYSFHGTGDFDVGHIALGARNFTNAFAQTDEYKKLIELGYIDIRYPMDNELGVRFEPWHIKVT